MSSEESKMLAGELYNSMDPVLLRKRMIAHSKCQVYNSIKELSMEEIQSKNDNELEKAFKEKAKQKYNFLQHMFEKVGNEVVIEAPFYCDYVIINI